MITQNRSGVKGSRGGLNSRERVDFFVLFSHIMEVKSFLLKFLHKRPLLFIPFIIEGILIGIGEIFLTGIPPMGLVTLTVSATLASVLINNRYSANELESYLKEQIEMRTQELSESEIRFRSLVNNIPGVAFRCRYNEALTMIYISEGIERMTGYRSNEFINNENRTFQSMLHPDNPVSLYDTIIDALNRDTSYQLEFRILDRNRKTRWFLGKGAGVKNGEGEIEFIDGVLIDITEEKQLSLEKEQWEKQNRQAQKLESIGRLAGGIAHDLNNLLTPVLGYAELTQSLVKEDGETEGYVKEIIGAARRARDLIQQLLSYSRGQKQPFENIDINLLIENFSRLLRKAIREDISIIYRPAPEIPPIRGNRSQLEQVILNLAVNAQDAMPGGGEITIMTDRQEEGVILMISDTGDGMDSETEEHLFEPFFTTKGLKGTGLGLATVYGIVQQHEGRISVLSNRERGTIFRMEFSPA